MSPISALAAAASFVPGVALMGSFPLAPAASRLAPIRGMAYQPVPSDYKPCDACVYYDSDFVNIDFKNIWGAPPTYPDGRGDLKIMSEELGINFLHIYDWNPARNHLPFLNEALKYHIRVAVPISNYFAHDPGGQAANIRKIIDEVYVTESGTASKTPHPAVVMWLIANEYDNSGGYVTAANIAKVAAIILSEEKLIGATVLLPISSPVTFGINGDPEKRPAVVAIQGLINAFKANNDLPHDFVATRFIAATNPQNRGDTLPGKCPPTCGTIAQFLEGFAGAFPGMDLWFAELGTGVLLSCTGYSPPCTPSEQQQATFNAEALNYSEPHTLTGGGALLGSAQFEFLDEVWKGGNDATFGVYKYTSPPSFKTYDTPANGPAPAGTYRVDNLVQKPSWAVLQKAFKSGTASLLAQIYLTVSTSETERFSFTAHTLARLL
jgi:hypothetical protein